jgi:predicted nucleic acid-binding Zn ribbon protein
LPSERRKAVPGAARSGEAEGLGSVLDGLLRERTWRAGMLIGDLARRWAEVVGDRLAEESRPAGLQDDVLIVKVASAAWATQIGFLADEVARRSNEVVGGSVVRSIRVLVDPDARGAGESRGGDVRGRR